MTPRRRSAGRAIPVVAAIGLALVLAGRPALAADDACAGDVVAAVQAHYDGVTDLRARFSQETASAAFGGEVGAGERATGRVEFAKPGQMRWTYETPEASEVVSDGKTLWIYDVSAHEVQVLPVGQGFLSGAAFEFLLGDGRIRQSFDAKVVSCAADHAELVLVPRQASTYERLELGVDPRTGRIGRTGVLDLFGNHTIVAFSEVEENRKPDPDRFHFAIPEGTRVIELPAR